MEKYKQFLINESSWAYEESEWDGHRNSGTGKYSTIYRTEVINPETGENLRFDDKESAKLWIDNHKVYAAANKALRKQRVKLVRKQDKFNTKIKMLTEQRRKIDQDVCKLDKNLHPEFKK